MEYWDVHTHRPSVHPEDFAIVNTIIGVKEEPKVSPFRSCGIHPGYIYHVSDQLEELRASVCSPHVVAVGEAGLDKRAESPMERQLVVFRSQVSLAEEMDKPLIIHCVKAWAELMAVRKASPSGRPWVIHGFRGNGELAKQLLRSGFFLSFGARFQLEALRAAWPDSLLVETDEQETDIRSVYFLLATSLNLPLDLFALKIRENVRRVFSV